MSDVTRMERVETGTMEPMLDGSFTEKTIVKFAWACLGCGLVWDRQGYALGCEARGHTAAWQQMYSSGPVINGVPSNQRFYPRRAIRRENLGDLLADEYDARRIA